MKMSVSRRGFLAGTVGAAALLGLPAFAQEFPAKAFTYIVPYTPGGMSDNISRLIGQKLTEKTGQQVVNDYKPGAGGAIGANFYTKTPDDGYTLLQATNSFFGVIPFVTKVEYDPLTDLTPLVLVGDAPMVMAVHPSVQANTLEEFIAYAKANPGALAYATAGKGTVGHLCGEWLQERAGIELLHIPYNGAAPGFQAAVAGEAQVVFGPEAAEFISAGSLKGIAVLGAQRWDRLPDLPTTTEAGIDGWTPRSWHTVVVHSSTPDAVKERLNSLLNEALAEDSTVQALRNFGLIPGIASLAEMKQRAVDDNTQFGELIRNAGLAVQ